MMTALALASGLLLLLLGGDALVRGAVAIATRLKVSPLVIGLTLVGFGTSMPELVASLQAALRGAPGIAVGNVVGSNIANILLILGLTALIFPVATQPASLRRDGTVLMVASLALVAIGLTGALSRPAGAILLMLLLAYTLTAFFAGRKQAEAGDGSAAADAQTSDGRPPMRLLIAAPLAVAGIVMVVLGADLLVGAAIDLATVMGVSQAVIGLTVVAVGTSLPELATAVMAALRRQTDVAFGNIVGSNIFNVFGIAGATALVMPVPVPEAVIRLDL